MLLSIRYISQIKNGTHIAGQDKSILINDTLADAI